MKNVGTRGDDGQVEQDGEPTYCSVVPVTADYPRAAKLVSHPDLSILGPRRYRRQDRL